MIRPWSSILPFIILSIPAFSARAACPDVTFEPRIVHTFAGGTGPFIGSVADVNLDGRSDVSVIYNDSNGYQSFLRNEDGTLTPGPVYATGSISELLISDLNGDGNPDAAAGSGFNLRLYHGFGTGAFISVSQVALTAAPTDVRAADLNEDDLQDLIVVQGIAGKVVVLTQTAPFAFSIGPQNAVGGDPGDPHVVDLDADGNLDVVMVNVFATVDVLYGRGDGTFDPVVKIVLPDTPSDPEPSGSSLAVGDFNFDGRLDFAAGQIQYGAAIFVNDGGRAFHFEQRVAPGAGASDLELADMNADGVADLILSTYGGFLTLLAQPSGFFAPPVFHAVPELAPFGGSDGMSFEIGDSRGDGRPDLIAQIGAVGAPVFATYPNACAAFLSEPIPTLSEWALFALLALLTSIGAMRLR